MTRGDAKKVQGAALKRVEPSKELGRRVDQASQALVAKAVSVRNALGISFNPRIEGSVAKDTWRANRVELDMFLLFPSSVPRDQLERLGLEVGQRVLDTWEVSYAEHPYVTGTWQGLAADVVPAYEIESPNERVSAVDRTPFHTAYVRRRLKRTQRADVRLLKQFMEGVGVYGAETSVGGFSGYLAELFVIRYGDLLGVLESARAWQRGLVIDLEATEHGLFDSPLVVVDPVDEGRNAAAGVTLRALDRFREAAKEYLDKPRLTFFFPNPVTPLSAGDIVQRMENKGTYFVGVEVPRPDLREDALLPHLRKASRNLATHLGLEGFVVIEPHVVLPPEPKAPALLFFELERGALPKTRVHTGPPETLEARVKEFREKWEGSPHALGKPFTKAGRWMVRVQRDETQVEPILRANLGTWHLGRYADEAIRGIASRPGGASGSSKADEAIRGMASRPGGATGASNADEAVMLGAQVLGPRELAASPARDLLTELVTGLRPWER